MADLIFYGVLIVVILVALGVWVLFKAVVMEEDDYHRPGDSTTTEQKGKVVEKDSIRNQGNSRGEK